MLKNKKILFVLFLFFTAALIPAFWVPVFESTGGRYAEISREMLASGNFMEPLFNGIKHFHKPPVTYWLNALGMFIFGVNGFGVRFFGAIAGVVTLVFTRKLAFVLTGDRKIADNALIIMASAALFLTVSRIVATDIYVTMFTVIAQYFMFSQIYGEKKKRNVIMFGMMLGLGFMTKGPVIFLFTFIPFVVSFLFDKRHRKAFSLIDVLKIFVIFCLISIPWYAYVMYINEGLFHYFLYDQTIERVATNKFHREKPAYFFFMIFFTTFLPWAFFFLRNLRFADIIKGKYILYLYIVLPFIIFELAKSKLGTYILPFYPVAAIIAAVNTDSKLLKKLGVFVVFAAGIAMFAAPFISKDAAELHELTFPSGAVTILLAYLLFKKLFKDDFEFSYAIMMNVIFMSIFAVIPFMTTYSKNYKSVAEAIQSFDKTGSHAVIMYKTFAPSLSFYLGYVVPEVFGKEREIQFQHRDIYKKVYVQTQPELDDFLKDKPKLILVTHSEALYEDFVYNSCYSCTFIEQLGKNKIIYACRDESVRY